MKLHIALFIVVAIAQSSCAKPPEPICHELDATIDRSIQQVALSLASGELSDRGAVQQAARYIAANNHLQVIRISLDLQKEHKCPIRKSAINPMAFQWESLQACRFANDKEKLKLCDIKNWKKIPMKMDDFPLAVEGPLRRWWKSLVPTLIE